MRTSYPTLPPSEWSSRVKPSALAVLGASLVCAALFGVQNQPQAPQPPFPDTQKLLARVAQHQRESESLRDQYVFTAKVTECTLDKQGKVVGQHADIYNMLPTPYEYLARHVSHDGKPVSEDELRKQDKRLYRKMQEDERQARQKGDSWHAKGEIRLADVIANSSFTPLRWEGIQGTRAIVYALEPKFPSKRSGGLAERVLADTKGKMWISPEEEEVVHAELDNVSSLSVGPLGLVRVKSFHEIFDQQKVRGEIWFPARIELEAEGRKLIQGFRLRQATEWSDYRKATTEVVQHILSPGTVSGGTVSKPLQ